MQPRPEKKDTQLTQASKINKALKDAPAIIVGNVADDKETPTTKADNPPVIPPIAD
ncbi:MAG: hypothetical protein AAFV98_23975 [Chloroflexota bacterium]